MKLLDGKRPRNKHLTQCEAEKVAKQTARNLEGGEVRIQGLDGRWLDFDTVLPRNDPKPPQDEKHWAL